MKIKKKKFKILKSKVLNTLKSKCLLVNLRTFSIIYKEKVACEEKYEIKISGVN